MERYQPNGTECKCFYCQISFLRDNTEHVDVRIVSREVNENCSGSSVQPKVVHQFFQYGGTLVFGPTQILIVSCSTVGGQQAPVRRAIHCFLCVVCPAAETQKQTLNCAAVLVYNSVSVTETESGLRSAIDETKAKVVLLLLIVNIITSHYFTLEIFGDNAGVVLDLDLSDSGDSQQHVLIVDEGLVTMIHGLVIVPCSPVEAIQ